MPRLTSSFVMAIAVAAISAVSAGRATAQNIVLNHSFEADGDTANANKTPMNWFNEGSAGGMTIVYNAAGSAGDPAITDGTHYLQYGRFLSQVTPTLALAGQQYTFSFDYRSFNTGSPFAQVFANPTPTNDGIDTGVATTVLLSEPLPTATGSTTHQSFTFTAPPDAAGKFLAVRFLTGNNLFRGLDNVSLTAVPEPASFALFAAAPLALLRRRRR